MQLNRRDNLFVLIGVGAVATGLAAMTLPRLIGDPAPPPVPVSAPAPEMVGLTVMVTREDVPRGAEVVASMLRPLRVASLPGGAAITRIEDALGRVAVERIPSGQIVLQDMMTLDRAKAGLAPLVPAGRRAVTVKVADDSGLGSFLRAGDLVDLLLVLKNEDMPKPQGKDKQEVGDISEARLLFNALSVLAVGDTLSEAPTAEKKQERVRILTLAATPEQTVQMALTRHVGVYSFTLRNPADAVPEETPTVTFADLRGEAKEPPAKPVVRRAPVARVAAAPGTEIIRGPVATSKAGL